MVQHVSKFDHYDQISKYGLIIQQYTIITNKGETMIYMWQENPRQRGKKGKSYFWFQTENKEAAAKMKRREKFKLVGRGFKYPIWIFQAPFDRPDIARNALKTLAGSKVKFLPSENVFCAKVTDCPSTPKKSPQS